MVDPETVVYNSLTNLLILYNNGSYSIAVFKIDGIVKYGIRWNGDESEESLGTPVSHGKPTWFLLPQDIAVNFLSIKIK